MNTALSCGDVVWTRVTDIGAHQWIRVVIDYFYQPDDRVVVSPLFPGDSNLKCWAVRREDIQQEEPSFDQIDATYEGDSEFQCV